MTVVHPSQNVEVGPSGPAASPRGGTTQVRPWGSYTVLDTADDYQVKRLRVHPGRRLSLQSHRFRSEDWIVVEGTATCTLGDLVVVVGPGGRVHVPRGVVHRIANRGRFDLVVVEVQRGPYLGEDDICRFEDDYGRGIAEAPTAV